MNILVCVKQVLVTQKAKMDAKTNTIIREGAEAEINPFDTYAVEEALRIKDQYGGTVTVISMGIPSVEGILKKAVAMGCDRAILLTDKRFAGSDTLATAYTLAKAVEKIREFDLIICGKQAIDGDTAQVGPSLSEKLGIPHTTCVKRIDQIQNGSIQCQRLIENGYEILEMQLPALITVVKDINTPRTLSLKGIIKSRGVPITHWNLDDIGADENCCGLKGSATQVVKTFTVVHDNIVEMIVGDTKSQVEQLLQKLRIQ